jgi:hypothetical protein
MLKRAFLLTVIVLGVALSNASIEHAAASSQSKGLFITPIREYIKVDAGKTHKGSLTVANITDKPVVVTLSVEQFSVADYSYDYNFTPVKEDWIKFQTPQLQLQPNKSQAVSYTVAAPKGATPGGHYFTIFASATLTSGPTGNKVRAAMVLYVTVNGQLRETSAIKKEDIPWISFGNEIDFSFDVKNTGNTHFLIYASGKLSGLTTKPATPEVTHVLLPGTVRTIGNTIEPPLLPGVYTATYGYRTEGGQVISHSTHILNAPPWSLLLPIGVAWVATLLWKRRNRTKKTTATDS